MVRAVFSRAVKRGDTVVDVGAYRGDYTLILLDLIGADGMVYAFEPEPANFNLLYERVKNCSNIVAERLAVSDYTGKGRLYLNPTNLQDHELYDIGRALSVEVDVVSLDDYFTPHSRIDFVKIDVQGVDYKVFKGMKRILRENEELNLMTEYWTGGLRAAGDDPLEYLEALKKEGFTVFDASDGVTATLLSEGDLKALASLPPNQYKDLLCLRG